MSKYQTNCDKILQAVIADGQLVNFYGYNPDDYSLISDALDSDIPVIQAIAQIIYRNEQNATEREIYNEVSNFLKSNI
ncbi:MAG: hypothetical protein IKO75_12440 [Bacteroidales bacterium]|nr:hypothetical protein [Bacteroidales bacterium]